MWIEETCLSLMNMMFLILNLCFLCLEVLNDKTKIYFHFFKFLNFVAHREWGDYCKGSFKSIPFFNVEYVGDKGCIDKKIYT